MHYSDHAIEIWSSIYARLHDEIGFNDPYQIQMAVALP